MATIKAQVTSCNFSWGIYGLSELAGWEDIILFDEQGTRIGKVCLNGKAYLRAALPDLLEDPTEQEFAAAIQRYLADDVCHYWYYYNHPADDDFYEVPYEAPRNAAGEKPRFTDIWHPAEALDVAAVQAFARQHLGLATCSVSVTGLEPLAEAIRSFQENERIFGGEAPIEIQFSDDVVAQLAAQWNLTPEATLQRLKKST